jgi:hypothetical protein
LEKQQDTKTYFAVTIFTVHLCKFNLSIVFLERLRTECSVLVLDAAGQQKSTGSIQHQF